MNLMREHDDTLHLKETAKRFNKYPRKKVKEDFNSLLSMFLDPELNFSKIAKKLRTSRQSIHQLYHQWFKPFAPDRRRPASRKVEVSPLIKAVMRRLNVVKRSGVDISADWKVVLYQRNPGGAYSVNVFRIVNDVTGAVFLCRVLETKTLLVRGSARTRYVRVQVSAARAKEVDFVIVVDKTFGERRFYFIPKEAILPFANEEGEIYLYLMENEDTKKQRTRSLAAYLEAWELLEEER